MAQHKNYYTVSQLAKLTALSVRALHHYDEIGLLKPSQRSAANYRWYSEADALKLREIVLFRELGFSLEQVAELITLEPTQRLAKLSHQRTQLVIRLSHQQAVLTVLDATLQTMRNENMKTTDQFTGLNRFQSGEYAPEAEAKWGNTAPWQQATLRNKNYGAAQWQAIQQESDAITQDFITAKVQGLAADDVIVLALAERHRQHLIRWFYDCDAAMHRCVSALYTSDPRFQQHYDQHTAGLAAFIVAACHANADRLEA